MTLCSENVAQALEPWMENQDDESNLGSAVSQGKVPHVANGFQCRAGLLVHWYGPPSHAHSSILEHGPQKRGRRPHR